MTCIKTFIAEFVQFYYSIASYFKYLIIIVLKIRFNIIPTLSASKFKSIKTM